MERSADWLRGAIEALNRAQRDFTVTVPELQAEYAELLAAAEAREAAQPTAAEVIAAAEKAIETGVCYLRIYRNEHKHLDSWLGSEDENTLLTDEEELARSLALIARWKESRDAK